ncbi:MAG: macro domain-containing protein [Cyclobacteriaceae bacterium]|nr:macro domain-containing protein [Cyclobacteriaceae bacterium]
MTSNLLFVKGDLLASRYHLDAIGHGCNCQGVMGSGIAKNIKALYPEMFHSYRGRCQKGMFRPGDFFIYRTDTHGPKWVLNLATQDRYGGGGPHASTDFIRQSLTGALSALQHVKKAESVKVGLPAIGAGLGGLSWEDTEPIYTEIAEMFPEVTLVVFRDYIRSHCPTEIL